MLDMLDLQSPRPDGLGPGMEQAQAWVLISLYEYMHLSPQQAWMSVGRCCRLVLGMRLYEIDDPTSPIALARDAESVLVDWIAVEEPRRTFWMAYSLDRLISFHHGLPFTLSEQLVGLPFLYRRSAVLMRSRYRPVFLRPRTSFNQANRCLHRICQRSWRSPCQLPRMGVLQLCPRSESASFWRRSVDGPCRIAKRSLSSNLAGLGWPMRSGRAISGCTSG